MKRKKGQENLETKKKQLVIQEIKKLRKKKDQITTWYKCWVEKEKLGIIPYSSSGVWNKWESH